MPPRVAPLCVDFVINPKCLMFHLRDQRPHLTHVLLMTIEWTAVDPIDKRYVDAIISNARSAAMCLAHLKSPRNLVPHGGNEMRDEYKM